MVISLATATRESHDFNRGRCQKKGNYTATARIAQHYPTAVKNAGIILQNLLKEGMPGLEDTDERNLWLCKNCRTFSTVQEAISFLESLKCE
jgi:hypothetical protein